MSILKVCFGKPSRNTIIVFNETNNNYLIDFVLDGHKPLVYHMRPEILFVCPTIVFHYFSSIINFNWQVVFTRKKKLRAITVELLNHYRLAVFKLINPKVVITLIDNSSAFWWLCKNYKGAKFFAIQNGMRTNYNLDSMNNNKFWLTNYFCFGNDVVNRYKERGFVIKKYFPIGSLVGGYVLSDQIGNIDFNKYDICLVSSGYPGKERYLYSSFWDSYEKTTDYFNRYSQEHSLKAAVLLRNRNGKKSNNKRSLNESNYFKSVLSNTIKIIYNNEGEYNTYIHGFCSKVVIGVSTTVIELFGLGKKVLVCDFSEEKVFTNYDPLIMFVEPNYKSFEKRMNALLEEPPQVYRERTKKYASNLMNFDLENLPHQFIRNEIKKYL